MRANGRRADYTRPVRRTEARVAANRLGASSDPRHVRCADGGDDAPDLRARVAPAHRGARRLGGAAPAAPGDRGLPRGRRVRLAVHARLRRGPRTAPAARRLRRRAAPVRGRHRGRRRPAPARARPAARGRAAPDDHHRGDRDRRRTLAGLPPFGAGAVGLGVALSSSVVIVNITRSRRRTTTAETEQALLGWSVLQDITGVALAVVLLAVYGSAARPPLVAFAGLIAFARAGGARRLGPARRSCAGSGTSTTCS